MRRLWLRRLAGGLVALSGASLIAVGLLLGRVDVMVLGLAGLIVVLVGLLVGLRFRLAVLQSSVEHLLAAMRNQMHTQLVDFKSVAAESNRLVLRSFRDMEIARQNHSAGLLDARQALDSLRSTLSAQVADGAGRWTANPEAVLAIVETVRARKPGLVVECGSGFSTVCIAQALRRNGAGGLVSLEPVQSHIQTGQRLLGAYGLHDVAEIRPVSVEACPPNISMLVLSASPDMAGMLVRYPLASLLDGLLPGALIVVNGVTRDDAEELAEWLQRQGTNVVNPRMISGETMIIDHLHGWKST